MYSTLLSTAVRPSFRYFSHSVDDPVSMVLISWSLFSAAVASIISFGADLSPILSGSASSSITSRLVDNRKIGFSPVDIDYLDGIPVVPLLAESF